MPNGVTLKTNLLVENGQEIIYNLEKLTNKPLLTVSDERQLNNIGLAINKTIHELQEWRGFFATRQYGRDRTPTPAKAQSRVINEKQLTEVTLNESKDNRRFIPDEGVRP